MQISLTATQLDWIVAHVATGDYASPEDAVLHLLDERIAELEADDMGWAKPYVEEARAAVAQGDFQTLDQHRAHMAAVLGSLGR